jgi:hypothetical protein
MSARHYGTAQLGIAYLATAAALCAAPGNTDKVTANLQHIASELNEAVKRYNAHLDREIAEYDRGSRTKTGRRIPGADMDLMGGPPDDVQTATRKLFEARVIASRRPGYAPPSLADCDRIQALIAEVRAQVELGSAALRRLQVVSAADLTPGAQPAQKLRLRELLKARAAAEEAAKRAFVALPVALPSADSADEQRERAWDLLVAKMPMKPRPSTDTPVPPQSGAAIPIAFREGHRVTLINELSCRVTLTDSGMEDPQGRHLFYQEEWLTRQGSLARTTGTGPGGIVILMRWAVAVDTRTGRHSLLRNYGPREFRGSLDELYELERSDYIPINPDPVPYSLQDIAKALAALDRSRAELSGALGNYARLVRESLGHSAACDPDLPDDLRESLFAIRARMGRVTAVIEAERNVRSAADQADDNGHLLEALVAWVNGDALEKDASGPDRALQEALVRSDAGIRQTRALGREALAALPPDLPGSEARLPPLRNDLIVRMTRANGLLRQEIWTFALSPTGFREVKRTVVLFEIDPLTGVQVPSGREVKYYRIEPGETLEEAYEEYASQAAVQTVRR